ncbi:hypothetical protein BDV12DRAFT_189513 [Aspergillus spectabilis]
MGRHSSLFERKNPNGYEFSCPKVYNTWNWPNNYPNYQDLRNYFDHVDRFDTESGRWNVNMADGRVTRAKYLVLGTGFAAKRYIPPGPAWTNSEVSCTTPPSGQTRNPPVNKRCAINSTGASGVQITQAWGPVAGDPKVFQRTPNLAVPMRKRDLTVEGQERINPNFAGFLHAWCERNTFVDTPKEREAFYESVWKEGELRYWVAVYKDDLFNSEANREPCRFWAKKTRAKMGDPKLRELLAPRDMPHYFVDIKANPIEEFTETGILFEDGTHDEFDVAAVATVVDVVTGVITQLGLKSIDGAELEREWIPGAKTYLGTTVSGAAGSRHDCQGRGQRGQEYQRPKQEAVDKWEKHVVELNDRTLFPTTRSTYMGGSISGKINEPVCYSGGIPAYVVQIWQALDNWEEGFDVVKA